MVNVLIVKEAIYWRGLFTFRYAAIEYAIAELVSRAFLHEAYGALGQPPFGPTKKLRRLRRILEIDGPIANHKAEIMPALAEFEQYEEYRNFMVHGIMVPISASTISFRMYDHREGVYSVGELEFEMGHVRALAENISSISIGFTELVSKICKEANLQNV